MKFSKQMAVTLLAALGGVLGNLIAAFIQASLGQITLLQVVFMLAGVVLVAAITYAIENKKRRHTQEMEQLRRDLAERRSRLRGMQSSAESGVALTVQEYAQWYMYQEEIKLIKERLRENGLTIADEYIETAPAPKAGLLIRLSHTLKSIGMLSVIFVAFLLSFPLSIGAQAAIVSLWNVPVEPELLETPTPFLPEPTAELEPTELPAPEPTESVLEESPTEEASFDPAITPTVQISAGLPTPTSTLPPTPVETVTIEDQALSLATPTGGGEKVTLPDDSGQNIVDVGTGSGAIVGRAVWDAQPVEGVKIGLTEGVNSGLNIIAVATTDQDGTFRFEELEAKQYGLIVEPPEGYSVSFDYCGRDVDHPTRTFNGLRFPSPIVAADATRDIGDIKLAAEVITAIYPINGIVVPERAPILRWEPYPEADRYSVCLFGIPGLPYGASQPFVDLSEYDLIDPGAIYWRVYAFTDNGLVGYSTRNDFILNE